MSTARARKAAPRRGRPAKISRDKIVAAAVELGLDSFSMQGIAEHLGVTSPALYSHVAGRTQVLALVRDALIEAMTSFESDATTWQGWLDDFAREVRTRLSTSASTLIVNFDDPMVISQLGIGESGLRLLLDAGFAPADAGNAVWLVFRTALTAGNGAQGDLQRLITHTRGATAPGRPDGAEGDGDDTGIDADVGGLAATGIVAAAMIAEADTDTLDFDLAAVIAGLEAHLARHAADPTRPRRRATSGPLGTPGRPPNSKESP